MIIRRRDLLALGGLVTLAPLLTSCAVARDAKKVASYFQDLPHVRSVKDSYNTADANDQVNIELELDEDVSIDDITALFADAEPALREVTTFPVDLFASWSYHGVRMERCARATYNSSRGSSVYDDVMVRVSIEGALTVATETAQVVECSWSVHKADDQPPSLNYVVDHGSADALPGDVALSLPRDLALDGYTVSLDQKVVLFDWPVTVTVTSIEGTPSAEGAPITELAAALPPPPAGFSHITVGDSSTQAPHAGIRVGTAVSGEDEILTLGAAAVGVLEEAGWRGVLTVSGAGDGVLREVVLDTSVSPTAVISESEDAAGLGERMLEQA